MFDHQYKYDQYFEASLSGRETRWASPEEIKAPCKHLDLNDENYPAGGLPILSDGKEAYVDDLDTHSLVYGATGSKKTRNIVMPLLNILIRAGESFVTTDTKAELYENSSGMAQKYGYDVIKVNLRDLCCSHTWNPMEEAYRFYHSGKKDKREKAIEMIDDFMQTIVAPHLEASNDIFWPEMARALLFANSLLLMDAASIEECNVKSLSLLSMMDKKELLESLMKRLREDSLASINYRGVFAAATAKETIGSIYASVYAILRVFNTREGLLSMLSRSDFDMRQIGKRKTAVYLIVPDEKTSLHFLVTTFIKQVYEVLIDVAQSMPDRKLPIRLNFVLDEFCNIPAIPDMASMISASRSRNMRFFLCVQSLHQLRGKYHEDADTIKGNCDNWVFLTSREVALLNEISELCGSYTLPTGITRSLISPSELQRLSKERGEALIMHGRQYPMISELADIDDYEMFKGFGPASLKFGTVQRLAPQTMDLEKLLEQVTQGDREPPFEE